MFASLLLFFRKRLELLRRDRQLQALLVAAPATLPGGAGLISPPFL